MAGFLNTIETKHIQKLSSRRAMVLDWVIVCLGLWMIGGAHLYTWAQHQFFVETYFSFWRSVWYSGYVAISTALSGVFLFNLKRSRSLRDAIPVGYEFSLVGVVAFFVGVLGDMYWHIVFDTSVMLVGYFNPWHILLAVGNMLIISGPIRATRIRALDQHQKWKMLMPAILSLALLLAEISFITSQPHPISKSILSMDLRTSTSEMAIQSLLAGISTILVQSALMIGVILYAIQRWRLPVGGITLIITIAYGLTVSIHENFLFAPFEILAGVGIEILYWWLRPFSNQRLKFRLFAFGVPVIFYSYYFLVLAFTNGVWKTINIWVGVILLSGMVGWLLSFGFLPLLDTRNPNTLETGQNKK